MKAIGATLRFLVWIALIVAVVYNTFTILQLRAEVDTLKGRTASRPHESLAAGHPHAVRPTPAHSTVPANEPAGINPRQRNWEDARREAAEAMTALQTANKDAQAASRRTIADLQNRIAELSERVESLTRQRQETGASPAEQKRSAGSKP